MFVQNENIFIRVKRQKVNPNFDLVALSIFVFRLLQDANTVNRKKNVILNKRLPVFGTVLSMLSGLKTRSLGLNTSGTTY